MILRAQHGNGRAGLGEPVRVGERGVREHGERPLQHRLRHPRAAVGQGAQRGHAGGRTIEVIDDPGQHRRHHHRARDPLAAHRVQPCFRGEAGQVHDPPPRVEVRQNRPETGDVIRRGAHERRLVLAGRGELDGLQHVRGQVLMAQQHALRAGGGAAGEQHDGGVGVRHLRGPGRGMLPGPLEELGARVGGHAGAGERRQEGIVRNHDRRLDLRDQVANLFRSETVVQGHERDARGAGGERGDGKRRAVLADEYGVTGPCFGQHPAAAGRGRGELLIGQAVGQAADCYPVRVDRHCHVQDHRDCHPSRLRPGPLLAGQLRRSSVLHSSGE